MAREHVRKNMSIGVGLEVTPGTEVDPTIFFPFMGDMGLKVAKGWLTRDDEAFGIIDAYPPDGGRVTINGVPLQVKLNPEVGMFPLYAVMGKCTSVQQGSSVAYKHTFETTVQDALPPSFTWEVDDTVDYLRASMMRLSDLELTFDAEGHVIVNTTWGGSIMRKLDEGDVTTPSFSTIRLYKFDDVLIKIGDRQTFANQLTYDQIENMSIKLNRPVVPVPTFNRLSYNTKFALEQGRQSIGNQFAMRFEDSDMRDLFWSSTTQPDSGAEYKSLEIQFIGDQIASTGFYYTTKLMFPIILISDHAVSGESLIEAITFDTFYDPLAGYFMQAEITNTMTSI